MKINTRLILLFVGITFVSTVFVALLAAQGSRMALRNAIGQGYQDRVGEGAASIESKLDEHIHEAEQLAKRMVVLDAVHVANHGYTGRREAEIAARIHAIDEEWVASRASSAVAAQVLGSELSRYLQEWTASSPTRYGEIFVTDLRGATVGATGKLSDYYQADEQWWTEGFAEGRGGLYMDDSGWDESAGAIVVGVVVPVRDGDRVIGILKINYKLDAAFSLPLADRLLEGNRTFLVRSNGEVIQWAGEDQAPVLLAEELLAMRTQPEDWREVQGRTDRLLRAYAPVYLADRTRTADAGKRPAIAGKPKDAIQWYVFLDVKSATAFAPLAALNRLVLVATLIALLMAVLIAWVTARSLSRPLHILRDGAEKIAGGDLTQRLAVESGDEIGELATSFNRMTGALETQIAALRDSEAQFSSVVNSAMDAIVSVDEDMRIVLFNGAAERMFGYPASAIRGQRLELLIPQPLRQAHERHVRQFAESGIASRAITSSRAVSGLRADGTEFPIEVSISQATIAGRKIFTAILRDITERKQAEEALRRLNDELEQRVQDRTVRLSHSNAELERFAYVASHDLQEPLRMVASYLQLIERRYNDKLDDNGREFIAFAVDGAGRMQRLINDLLEFSRVQTRGKPFELVDMERLLAEVLSDLKIAIEESAAVVTHDSLPGIVGDAGQLRRLLQNLIGNALKYRSEERALRIHLSARRLENTAIKRPEGAPAAGWLISVQDNGIGIEAQYYEKVFHLFQRLHTRKDYPGNGLGLALCKRIVERHGGTIWLESIPGDGSVFYCAFPDMHAPGALDREVKTA